jgi:hypothetical protein
MVLDRGGLLVNVSAMAASSVAGLLREHERPRGTVLMNAGIAPGLTLPEPYGRRRCLGIAEQHGGWLGPIASGKTVSTYMCVTERGLHGALLAVNATGLIGRVAGSAAGSAPVLRRPPSRSGTGSRSGGAAPCWPRGRCAAGAITGARPPPPS